MRAPCVLLRILCPPDPQCRILPDSELPWLVAGLPVYYHRSNGDRVSATVVDPSPRGGRRVSIRYALGGEEVLYEHAPEERLEFAIVTAESPDSPQPVHHEAPMDALLEPLELMIMSQNAVADEIEIPVTQPVLLLVLSPVHGLLRRCMQGAENRTLEPVTSIRLKIEESWYASMDCKVQKSGPWVCFYGGHSTGYKLGHHPKNIEPCAHRARTVRQRPLCVRSPGFEKSKIRTLCDRCAAGENA